MVSLDAYGITRTLRAGARHLSCQSAFHPAFQSPLQRRRIVVEAVMEDWHNVQINMQRIPVGSSVGAGVLIAILLLGLFLDLPGVRGTAIGGGAVGLLLAGALIAWRRRTAGNQPHPTLGITAK